MELIALLFGFGCATFVAIYALRTFGVQVLSNKFVKESNALRLEINKAQRMLRETGEYEPEEMVAKGLSNAGLGELLQNLDKESIEKALGIKIPAHYWMLAQGFLSKMKPTSVGQNEQKQPPHPRQ